MLAEVLIPISLFATVFGVFYLYLTTRNRERMALIEKGADASMFNTGSRVNTGRVILSLGLLAIGVGLGVLVGAVFTEMGMDDEVAFPASIFMFAGMGMVLSFFLNRRLEKR